MSADASTPLGMGSEAASSLSGLCGWECVRSSGLRSGQMLCPAGGGDTPTVVVSPGPVSPGPFRLQTPTPRGLSWWRCRVLPTPK